ncbi:YolD-like family protein [Paenibacillus ginsengarvi]|uniref:YolD-like family protein n=2 Tax=Paenibacillus ginsengarvi TaxID=400777 RepID=A0A3B0CSR8_9BACL|nr:YolD-like family protein [Paenibacillus ginsengarvi]
MAKKLEGNGIFESSRMMLPEHVKAYVRYKHETEMTQIMAKHKQKRPTRDEFELEALGEQLTEAKNEDREISLTVWGETDPVIGRIIVMDARTRLVHVEWYGTVTKVPFLDIMKVSSVM